MSMRDTSSSRSVPARYGNDEMPSRREFLRTSFSSSTLLMIGSQLFAKSGDLTSLSLQEASMLVQSKAVSPVDLTRACLERIQRLNPTLNAFITVTTEQALAQAHALEKERQRGRSRGPLHGIPIALKDNIDTEGVKTTAASTFFANRIPTEDAEVVRRLKAAGAVIIGKLNMHEFASGTTSTISHFGPVHNPWNLDRIAGGSSGGSAVAVAAGLCYGTIGTDTGASVRLPAACCGIVGLKPTYGLVSARGVIPTSWSFDHVGPMCRTVTDTALLLSAIAGYDPDDSASIDVPPRNYLMGLGARTRSFRLGIPRTPFYENLDPEIEAAVRSALEVLSPLTERSQEVKLPPTPDLFSSVADAETYAFHAPNLAKTPELYNAETRRVLQEGAKVSMAEYMQGRRDLDRMRRIIGKVFASVDLLVTPTMPKPPLTIAECREARQMPPTNTGKFNIFGLPSISIPCGFTKTGLPIGLQISGPRLGEAKVFALAHAYEQATDWHRRRPVL
jgi:aspartyl-tRNA(Asn)/glutamyl-tRNA(Gln) amidotransferase subunit A